ncbi:hypothetical protein GCM10027018_28400 [Paenibacillus thermoaerophilus]
MWTAAGYKGWNHVLFYRLRLRGRFRACGQRQSPIDGLPHRWPQFIPIDKRVEPAVRWNGGFS